MALGPRSSDDDAVAVITTLFNAWVLGMLQTTGRTEDEAVELVSDLLIAWLETRAPRDGPDVTGRGSIACESRSRPDGPAPT